MHQIALTVSLSLKCSAESYKRTLFQNRARVQGIRYQHAHMISDGHATGQSYR